MAMASSNARSIQCHRQCDQLFAARRLWSRDAAGRRGAYRRRRRPRHAQGRHFRVGDARRRGLWPPQRAGPGDRAHDHRGAQRHDQRQGPRRRPDGRQPAHRPARARRRDETEYPPAAAYWESRSGAWCRGHASANASPSALGPHSPSLRDRRIRVRRCRAGIVATGKPAGHSLSSISSERGRRGQPRHPVIGLSGQGNRTWRCAMRGVIVVDDRRAGCARGWLWCWPAGWRAAEVRGLRSSISRGPAPVPLALAARLAER